MKSDKKQFLYYTLFLGLTSSGFGTAILRVFTRQGLTKSEDLDDGDLKHMFDLSYQTSEIKSTDEYRSPIQPRTRGGFGYWYSEHIMLPDDLEINQFATAAPKLAAVLTRMEKAQQTYNLGYKFAVPNRWTPDPLPIRLEALELIGATPIHTYDHRWHRMQTSSALAAEAHSVSRGYYS
jgi:hypothetical protein